MALLKFKEVLKMSPAQKKEKLKELEFALTRTYVTANKANAKTKEIKRAIARLKTYKFNQSFKEELKTSRLKNLDGAQELKNHKKVLDTKK